jgi:hypothetical protein
LIDFIAEPGLFEWLAWYQDGMPDWMSGEELVAAGYNIQLAYKPYISAEELQESTESCQQFYIRNFFVTQCALQVRLWHSALFRSNYGTRSVGRNQTSELIS